MLLFDDFTASINLFAKSTFSRLRRFCFFFAFVREFPFLLTKVLCGCPWESGHRTQGFFDSSFKVDFGGPASNFQFLAGFSYKNRVFVGFLLNEPRFYVVLHRWDECEVSRALVSPSGTPPEPARFNALLGMDLQRSLRKVLTCLGGELRQIRVNLGA